jgi:hypothetical protein
MLSMEASCVSLYCDHLYLTYALYGGKMCLTYVLYCHHLYLTYALYGGQLYLTYALYGGQLYLTYTLYCDHLYLTYALYGGQLCLTYTLYSDHLYLTYTLYGGQLLLVQVHHVGQPVEQLPPLPGIHLTPFTHLGITHTGKEDTLFLLLKRYNC